MTRTLLYILALATTLASARDVAVAQQKSTLKTVYSKQAFSLLENKDSIHITGFVPKDNALLLIEPQFLPSDRISDRVMCKVRTGDGRTGYTYNNYLTESKEEAGERYMAEKYDTLHMKAKDNFRAGDPLGCDYYPRNKPDFEGNGKPEVFYGLYLTSSYAILKNIDSYIEFAKSTKVNTFVIDIKEDGLPGFKAEAMKKYCPSAYRAAQDNAGLYDYAVRRLHEEGFWVVARIVTFKDYHFTKDHPECSIWDKESNTMLYHNKSHWPSAYCRLVWEYNVALAMEAVDRFGFNEINFDYVRFPDRMTSIENRIDMRNRYHESKIQAIQRFVTYAVDMIHRKKAYVSIDVFGESANPGYTTPYGQYWPAISNVADIICGMPYPDHFANGYYGIKKPWNHPYELMKAWGGHVCNRQAETPSPAIVRTWIQAYHVMKHVDPEGIPYNAENMEKEIRGLFDAGLTGGYVPWLASGSLEQYKSKAEAFKIDYRRE